MPNPSPREGTTTTAFRSNTSPTGTTWPRNVTPSGARFRSSESSGPAPATSSRQLGHIGPRELECAQQDVEPLDRNQPADRDEPRGGRCGRRLRSGFDAVVDNGEGVRGKTFGLDEVPREPVRDRDLRMGEARRGAVGGSDEGTRAELIEPVLRADSHRNTRERACWETKHVRVHEMCVENRRPLQGEPSRNGWVEVEAHSPKLRRHGPRAHRFGELIGAGLALMQHEHARVPPAVAEQRQHR